ncbi:hypothetical protein ACFQ07_20480, partial [Actinomadura adrarensis]
PPLTTAGAGSAGLAVGSTRLRHHRPGGVLVFDTGSGGQERFTYDFLVRNGQITDVVGRYA